uniref:Cytochrome c1-2 heme protein-like n=1 Tax=Rhizophora mucronata TaxID=61149 RepID=A0A2P2L7G2_RHIMU
MLSTSTPAISHLIVFEGRLELAIIALSENRFLPCQLMILYHLSSVLNESFFC